MMRGREFLIEVEAKQILHLEDTPTGYDGRYYTHESKDTCLCNYHNILQ